MSTMSTPRARLSAGAAATVFLIASAGSAPAAPPLDPPRQYEVRGDGAMTVSGPNCCGGAVFSGRFEAAYQVHSSGQVTLASLNFRLDDTDVEVRGGFLDLFSETLRLRCAAFGLREPGTGWVSGGELHFPAGSVRLGGASAEERLPGGACAAPTLALREATNHGLLKLTHDPIGNAASLDGNFTGSWLEGDGESYDIELRATGRFDNRPPVASLQFETPESPQGRNCPAFWRPNPAEWVAEANHPGGLVTRLRSSSVDPDGAAGASARADLLSDRWLLSRDGGPRTLLGLGYRTDTVGFEWGPSHRLELLSMDQAGATAAAQCTFRVVDTRPPVVTPPAATTVACSQTGGASAGTSDELRAFLTGARAADVVSTTPVPLPAQVAGVTVTDSTLFPADGVARRVTFRFRDGWGNVGTAGADLTVTDSPPAVTVLVVPARLPADKQWHYINAYVTGKDDCGGPVVLKLHKITSNAPSYDDDDITGATFGTDDRTFWIYAHRRNVFKLGPRVFRVMYKGTDSAGLYRHAYADLVVD